MNKIIVISDFNHVLGLILLSEENDIDDLRKEFESILDPGENPCAYNTTIQDQWIDKKRNRENYLVEKYGGCESGYSPNVIKIYSPKTFIGWLVAEKNAKEITFLDYTMAEFD